MYTIVERFVDVNVPDRKQTTTARLRINADTGEVTLTCESPALADKLLQLLQTNRHITSVTVHATEGS